jgi:hypothetical protein
LLSLADAQTITNPHKAAAAMASPAGQWLNKADHSARATSRVKRDLPDDDQVARE